MEPQSDSDSDDDIPLSVLISNHVTSDSISNIQEEEQNIPVEDDDNTWETGLINNFKSSDCNTNSD